MFNMQKEYQGIINKEIETEPVFTDETEGIKRVSFVLDGDTVLAFIMPGDTKKTAVYKSLHKGDRINAIVDEKIIRHNNKKIRTYQVVSLEKIKESEK